MKKLLVKLIACFLVLTIFVLLFSMLVSENIIGLKPYEFGFIYTTIVCKDLAMRLAPSIIAIVYAIILIRIMKNHQKKQLVMIINSIVVMILSAIMGITVFYYTSWFDMMTIFTYTQTMFIICFLNIVLSLIILPNNIKSNGTAIMPNEKIVH
ncbi:MAG: hypothetical protein ABFD18_03535 [Syntrophomonas sp.]